MSIVEEYAFIQPEANPRTHQDAKGNGDKVVVARSQAEQQIRGVLDYIGEESTREGLLDTPRRCVKFLEEFLNPPEFTLTVFDAEGMGEMVVQKGIRFNSLCEHHLVPFFGTGAIAYIPSQKIVGLSKLARTLEWFSRRLQNQERITQQVASFLEEGLQAKGVAVRLSARHMCMEMRGVQKPDTETVTIARRGEFLKRERWREFVEQV